MQTGQELVFPEQLELLVLPELQQGLVQWLELLALEQLQLLAAYHHLCQ
jgi:hypothetical protein